MAVTVDPSTEAMMVLVARINSGEAYCLDVAATYSELIVDPLEDIHELRVDVVTEQSEQLNETLAVEDRTSHQVRVWIRAKPDTITPTDIDPLKLVARQIFQRLNNWDSADGRVRVWECDMDPKEIPDKNTLHTLGLFVTSVLMRVQVEAS